MLDWYLRAPPWNATDVKTPGKWWIAHEKFDDASITMVEHPLIARVYFVTPASRAGYPNLVSQVVSRHIHWLSHQRPCLFFVCPPSANSPIIIRCSSSSASIHPSNQQSTTSSHSFNTHQSTIRIQSTISIQSTRNLVCKKNAQVSGRPGLLVTAP